MSTENPTNPSSFELAEAERSQKIRARDEELGLDGAVYQDYITELETLIQHKSIGRADLLFLYRLSNNIGELTVEDRDAATTERRNKLYQLVCEKRDHSLDLSIILECNRTQIANTVEQITEDTVAYIGPLEPDIFNRLPENIEHVYTKFPEGKIRRENLEIGGKSGAEYIRLLEQQGYRISPEARFMLNSQEFTVLKEAEEIKLIRLSVADLGFLSGATTKQIFERSETLGLELCPPEVGPAYRLQYINQPMDEWIRVGMKAIADLHSLPSVFDVGHNSGGARLSRDWAEPAYRWGADDQILFRLRKKPLVT